MNYKDFYWSIAITNCVSTIAWIVIAIVFDKWWIALLSLLTYTYYKKNQDHTFHYRVCDNCGKRSPDSNTFNGAIDNAKAAGWKTVKHKNMWLDFCPDCQKEINIDDYK